MYQSARRMQTADFLSPEFEKTDMPVARIDAQDEPYVLPLREYLEANGVRVVVNDPRESASSYHIAVGDADFVEENFRTGDRQTHRLGIVIGSAATPTAHAKYIFVDAVPLNPKDVVAIFAFFFTGGGETLDMRRTPHHEAAPKLVSRLPAVAAAATPSGHLEEGDRARIEHLVADMFDRETPKERLQKERKKRKKHVRRRWVAGVIIGGGLGLVFALWYVLSVAVSGVATAYAARSLAAGDLGRAKTGTIVADYWVRQGKAVLGMVSVPLALMGQKEVIRSQERLMSFFSDTVSSETQLRSLVGVAEKVSGGLLNQVDVTSTGVTSASDITELRTTLASVQNLLGLSQAELTILLADRTFPFSFGFVRSWGAKAVGELQTIRKASQDTDELLSLFLRISGFKEPRTYLILLQNSMELRPTGGFIGSVALASFADGRMTDLTIQDVYTYDGQLKGHVDPPAPLRQLLGTEHWYLRDSNWDPDFSQSAARAAWFYEKEAGSAVDGVIAVNTPFVVALLRATGPIDLPDYNDRITAENFYGKSLYYTQSDFFPGSTQKKDFLGTLARALITKITTGKSANPTALFRAVTTSLAAHDLMMMFRDPELQSVVAHWGWAGRVPPEAGCEGAQPASCTFDPLILVEANLGVNKVNYFVKRSIDREVIVDSDGRVKENVTLTLRNTSASGGQSLPYRVYVQMPLPPGTTVHVVTADGTQVPTKDPKSLTIPYMEKTDIAAGNFTLGIAMDVPAGAQKRLVVSYEHAKPLLFGPSGTILDLFDQKQPGVGDTQEHTTVRYPFAWTAGMEEGPGETGPAEFIAKDGQLEYNTILSRDELHRVRLTK